MPPGKVQEFANQTVAYVQRALGLTLEYDSDTLPILDHYLREVPRDRPETLELVVLTSAAYFGEVVRRRLGGRWELGDEPRSWQLVLPSGIRFTPAGLTAAAIAMSEVAEVDTALDAPARMRPHLHEALQRMGQVTAEEFYSLCGRLDTLEHLHEVLVSVAAATLGAAGPHASGEPGDAPDAVDDVADVVADDDADDAVGSDGDTDPAHPPDPDPLVN